jgi:hypothetical protein
MLANDRFTASLFTSFAANKVGASEIKNQANTGESQTLVSTSERIRLRPAPSAMRRPISRDRRTTEKAITP